MRLAPSFLVAIVVAIHAIPGTAFADDRDDFSDDVKAATGEYSSKFVIQHLSTFKLGDACWKKMHDKRQYGPQTATAWARATTDLVKRGGGDDWAAAEGEDAVTRDKNKDAVEKLVKDASKKVSFTLVSEGADCDAGTESLMLKYWSKMAEAMAGLSGKHPVKITLTVGPKVKDITVKSGKDSIAVTASSTTEPADWDKKIKAGFEKSKL